MIYLTILNLSSVVLVVNQQQEVEDVDREIPYQELIPLPLTLSVILPAFEIMLHKLAFAQSGGVVLRVFLK